MNLMVYALDSRSSSPRSSPGLGHCIELLGRYRLHHIKQGVICELKNIYLQEMAGIFVDNLFLVFLFIVLFTLTKKGKYNVLKIIFLYSSMKP